LGGNKKGKVRTYVNLMLTMLLGGLWHGASLKFVWWGGLHGIALSVHKFTHFNLPISPSPVARKIGSLWGILLTFHFVCFCWIFFRASDMDTGWLMISQISQNFKPQLLFDFLVGYKAVVFLMVIGYVLHLLPKKMESIIQEQVVRTPLIAKAALVTLIILIIVQIKSAGVQPFIYFQF
jgi:D-alanyl-lipoteichoic acid acyltransferase DltB (MBOAT superfamily)